MIGKMRALQQIAIGRIGIKRGTGGDKFRYGRSIGGRRLAEGYRVTFIRAVIVVAGRG